MLREIKDTYQRAGEPRKRWFTSLDIDVFVWLDDEQNIMSYHLAYDKQMNERALVWNQNTGFSHSRVDDGVRPGKYPGSPIMRSGEPAAPDEIVSMLLKNQGELEPGIKAFIISGVRAILQGDDM